MSEPQPSNAEEVDQEPASVALPANASAEDRKAAAALSSLDAPTDDSAALPKSQADQKALGEAISRLEGGKSSSSSKETEAKKKEEVKKKVKVEASDVTMLVEHLELSKTKATELLRAHDGKLDQALEAYITSPTLSKAGITA